jgi:precorrin-6B methylase 2
MGFNEFVKGLAHDWFPDAALRISSRRSRRLIERQTKRLGLDHLARTIAGHTGSRVLSGPFAGLQLDYEALPVHSAPKLIGTYEREIAAFVEDAIRRAPPQILNIGASDGYYAVGMARRLPNAIVYACDTDPKSLSATMRNAGLNGVSDRVSPLGLIDSNDYGKYLRDKGSLLLMDCEGAEFKLLPACAQSLRHANIIVEVHPEFGSCDSLVAVFRPTHAVQVVHRHKREISDYPVLISGVDPLLAMDERRGDQTWLYFTAESA